MSSKFEFDETRKAIGADGMSEKERREMLDRFKDAGGEIRGEKEVRPPGSVDDDSTPRRRAGGGSGQEIKTPSQLAKEKRRAEADRNASVRAEWDKAEAKISSGSARFMLKLRCAFMGISPFGGRSAKFKFMNYLALDVKEALVNFNLIGNQLFLKNPGASRKIVEALDAQNPLYMEVLEAAHSLYKHSEFEPIVEYSQANKGSDTPFDSIDEHLKAFFRKLYYIYPYQEALKRALQVAIDLNKKEADSDEERNLLETYRKRILKDVKKVFQLAYSRIFHLVCRIDGRDYPPFSKILEKFLDIKNEDKLGQRKKGASSKLVAEAEDIEEETEEASGESADTEDTDEPQKEEDKEEEKEDDSARAITKTREYQYGMSLMKLYPLPELRKKVDPNGQYNDLPLSDRVFQAYLFFSEFDLEYSFVQTTSKITLNPDFSSGSKTDYRQELADLYNNSRSMIRAFEKYHDEFKEWQKLQKNKVSTSYVEQSKMEGKHEKNVQREGRDTRNSIKSYMENITRYLAILIADMKGEKKIVANMQDTVEFDKNFEGNKRLNGKLVQQCLMEAYCFTLTLKERLENGDLFGGIINMTDEEMVELYGNAFKDDGSTG